jgi:sarcosine oxidase
MPKTNQSFDVVIVGGGVIGSAIACFLKARADFDGRVAVVERDPSYADCTTARSVGGIRQQFSTRENILLSQFAAEFVKNADRYLAVDDASPQLAFVEAGYLFLVGRENIESLKANQARQSGQGARVVLLEPAELKTRFPWLSLSGVALGSFGLENEGWIDPYGLLVAFRDKAKSLGVRYLNDEVTGLALNEHRVESVALASGDTLGCDWVVNAAGARAADVAAMARISLPVAPRKRQVFVFECRTRIPDCPLVIDPSGMYFRPESGRFLCGISPPQSEDPDTLDHEVDHAVFEELLWPMLARRVPAFEAVKLASAWACTYAYNTFDQNAIVGTHPEITNFVLANGFSGHGLQQSPGVGRAVAELISCGEYRSIDLTRFGFERILAQAPVRELNVV